MLSHITKMFFEFIAHFLSMKKSFYFKQKGIKFVSLILPIEVLTPPQVFLIFYYSYKKKTIQYLHLGELMIWFICFFFVIIINFFTEYALFEQFKIVWFSSNIIFYRLGYLKIFDVLIDDCLCSNKAASNISFIYCINK